MNKRLPRPVGASALASTFLALAAALAGCAIAPEKLAVGTPREQVIQSLGQPTATWQMPSGATRLQYSRQPQGRQIYDVDLDTAGKVAQVRQVLDERYRNTVPVDGSWTRDDVLREFGQPAMTATLRSVPGQVWSYRYMGETAAFLFHIDIDPQGVVRRTYSTLEPIRPWVGG